MTKFNYLTLGEQPDYLKRLDALILATGFEDRAFEVISTGHFSDSAHVFLVQFKNDVYGNAKIRQKYFEAAEQKFASDRIHVVNLRQHEVENYMSELRLSLLALPPDITSVGVDISGMPTYLIFATLEIVRSIFQYQKQYVIYSSALEYIPTKSEYEALANIQGEDIEYIPKPMALEMDENLIFDPFSGYRSGDRKSCLALFAGYEPYRSTGVVEAINPSMLLLIYGRPLTEEIKWRLDLSRRLHHKFERTRRCAVETVCTNDVSESLEVLENYYKFLIDDYDLTISPICSKMQTVASFLFWERYPEIQVSFPIPINYDTNRAPTGVKETFVLELPGRLAFPSSTSEERPSKPSDEQ